MAEELFSKFSSILRDMSEAELLAEIERPKELLVGGDQTERRKIDIAYAPFDCVNDKADVVIVGLTPGRQQMRNALFEARRHLKAGGSDIEAMSAAKTFASFSGPMRANLVAMLDSIGVNRALRLASTASLWTSDSGRAHFTSALRYPVFVDGMNYSGAPSILSTPILRDNLMQWFARELALFPNAAIVPLGPKVSEAIEYVAARLAIPTARILSGLPHPSGANAERIAFFLGRKRREDTSAKVDAERLVRCRSSLEGKVGNWG